MANSLWGICLAFGMIIGGASAASAASTFDGSWSVSVRGSGKCEAGAYYALRVENGRVTQQSGDAVVSGHVDGNGNVRVSIRHQGGHGATGSGHLSGSSGGGTWRGQRAAILCTGRWEAQKL
jgi:hypothetical protein